MRFILSCLGLQLFRHCAILPGLAAKDGNQVYRWIIDNSLFDPAYVDRFQPSTLIGNPVCG